MGLSIPELTERIRDVPDFPKPGILFKDITPLLKDPAALRQVTDQISASFEDKGIDLVASVESRGFILATPVALNLGAGIVPIRKLGKLPADTINTNYELEYGTNTLEMHRDAIQPGQRVLIVDDVLATGGTVKASIDLVERLGGIVAGIAFLAELTFLDGREPSPATGRYSAFCSSRDRPFRLRGLGITREIVPVSNCRPEVAIRSAQGGIS